MSLKHHFLRVPGTGDNEGRMVWRVTNFHSGEHKDGTHRVWVSVQEYGHHDMSPLDFGKDIVREHIGYFPDRETASEVCDRLNAGLVLQSYEEYKEEQEARFKELTA